MFRITSLFVAMGFALTLAVSAFCGGAKGTHLPDISLKKPASGLEMRCSLRKKAFRVGDSLAISCTITNTTDKTKTLIWNPRVSSNFWLSPNDEFPPTAGIGLMAYPEIHTPMMIKSLGWLDFYILYLPPRESLTFSLRLQKLDKPGEFKGRVKYDPLPKRNSFLIVPDGSTWEDEYVTSGVFEYKVVEPKRK